MERKIEKVLKQEQLQMFLYSSNDELLGLDTNFLRVTLAKTGMTRTDIDKLTKLELVLKIKEKLEDYMERLCSGEVTD